MAGRRADGWQGQNHRFAPYFTGYDTQREKKDAKKAGSSYTHSSWLELEPKQKSTKAAVRTLRHSRAVPYEHYLAMCTARQHPNFSPSQRWQRKRMLFLCSRRVNVIVMCTVNEIYMSSEVIRCWDGCAW